MGEKTTISILEGNNFVVSDLRGDIDASPTEALEHLRQHDIAYELHLPLQEECGRILLSHHHAFKVFPTTRKRAICFRHIPAYRQCSLVHSDEPTPYILYITLDGSRDTMQQGFVTTCA